MISFVKSGLSLIKNKKRHPNCLSLFEIQFYLFYLSMSLLKKLLLTTTLLVWGIIWTSVFAQFPNLNLELSGSLASVSSGVSQNSSPRIDIFLTNKGQSLISWSNIPAWFITCTWKEQNTQVYSSKEITQLTINPDTTIKKTITLDQTLTEAVGDKNIMCTINGINSSFTLPISVITAKNFDLAMTKAIDPIKNRLDAPVTEVGVNGVNQLLFDKVMNVLVPLIILLGILTSILWFYKIFFSSDDKGISTWVKLIWFWVLWIVIIMSANFFATTLYSDIFLEGNIWPTWIQWYDMAQKLYEKLLFPFIKIAVYLSLGVLFLMMASRVIGFVFGTDEDTRKKSWTIIVWNVIGMLVIIGAKQLVEFVYGAQEKVVKPVATLWDIWSWIFASRNLPLLYQIINWAMGLASLFILIMVLVQAFQLLIKPDSPDAMKKIKNTLLYIFVGILIIGTGYVITNFLIIN